MRHSSFTHSYVDGQWVQTKLHVETGAWRDSSGQNSGDTACHRCGWGGTDVRTCVNLIPITSTFHHSHRIPVGVARKPKRGCQAGHLARLMRASSSPLLPSLYIANARSLGNKMDKLRLDLSARTATHVMVITELQTVLLSHYHRLSLLSRSGVSSNKV